jgi:hypothetical protein
MAEEGHTRARESEGSAGRKPTTRDAAAKPERTRSAARSRGTRSREQGSGKRSGNGDRGKGQALPSAPSLGPNTVVEREPVEERLARHEQSNVDAMGHDKRRPVVGQSYGPSKARQLALYGIFLAVVAALLIGGKLLVDSLDTPVGKNIPNSAPWAQPNAKQHPPKPLQ